MQDVNMLSERTKKKGKKLQISGTKDYYRYQFKDTNEKKTKRVDVIQEIVGSIFYIKKLYHIYLFIIK